MPRRYATYAVEVGPVELFASLHQVATLGVVVLVVGQLLFVWNLVTSWLEGPRVQSGDPWDLDDRGQFGREFAWFERERLPVLTDGGEDERGTGESGD